MKFLFHLVKVNEEERELNFQPQINSLDVRATHPPSETYYIMYSSANKYGAINIKHSLTTRHMAE